MGCVRDEGRLCERCVRRLTVKVEVPLCPNHFTCRHHKTVEDVKQELAMISAVSKPFHPVLL